MRKSSLPPGSKVWIVARHSPGKSQSITAQLGVLEDYCRENELVITDRFIDAGESGGNRSRAEFNRLIKTAESFEKNLVDGVIFYDLSRLARNFDDAQYAKALLRYRGYRLEWLEGEQLDGIAGNIVETVEDYENARYLKMISRKSKDGLRQMFKLKDDQGNYLGFWAGAVPWGFKAIEKVLPVINTVTGKPRVKQCIEPDYDLWPLGQKLYELRAGGVTYREIENQTGFFGSRGTVNVDNYDVLASSYKHFFRNPIYKGTLIFQELALENYTPAMVGAGLWQAANNASIRYKRGHWEGVFQPRVTKANPDFVLAGLCECGLCDGPFYCHSTQSHKRNKLHRYYLCRTKRQKTAGACNSPRLPASPLEVLVIDHATRWYFATLDLVIEEMNDLLKNDNGIEAEISRKVREAAEADKAISNLIRLTERLGNIEETSRRISELNQQKKLTEFRIEQLKAHSNRMAIAPAEIARISADLKEKLLIDPRVGLRQITEKIIIGAQIRIEYRIPLCITDRYPWVGISIPQTPLGYILELPVLADR